MHPQATVDSARCLSQQGLIDREVALITGVSIGAVQKWRTGIRRSSSVKKRTSSCPRGDTDWQRAIVERYPGDFARGLFHSDGYRGVNRVRGRLLAGDRWYEYPRYLFVNESEDILQLCGRALDLLGVAWRFSKPNTISVARKYAVARLDESVGPKY